VCLFVCLFVAAASFDERLTNPADEMEKIQDRIRI
jgi:hypothetical protein